MLEILLPGLLLALGIFLVVKCGDWFVDAAIWLSEITGIPRFIVGATVVSLGTTLPELLVSVFSAHRGLAGMALGNAVGSVSCNLGLILGVSLLLMPKAPVNASLGRKGMWMLLAGGLLWLLAADGQLSPANGLCLLAAFGLVLWENLREGRRAQRSGAAAQKPAQGERFLNLVKFLGGILGIVLGAQLMVDNGSALARLWGVPEGIIGLTLLAVGTSLPELITTLTALRRKEAALSVGNVLGANLIDLLLVPAACALVGGGGLQVLPQMVALNIPMALVLGGLTLLPALLQGRFSRGQGAALLLTYGGYIGWMIATLA